MEDTVNGRDTLETTTTAQHSRSQHENAVVASQFALVLDSLTRGLFTQRLAQVLANQRFCYIAFVPPCRESERAIPAQFPEYDVLY